MKKLIAIILLTILVGGAWYFFVNSGKKIETLSQKIEVVHNENDPRDELADLESELAGIENERVFQGVILTFLSAGLAGIVFVSTVLPYLAGKTTEAMYGSGEEVEPDPFVKARVFVAQGEWEKAIEAFTESSKDEPSNPLPWLEIAKIQQKELEDPMAAASTIANALQGQEWEVDDAAFFMFRLSEIYQEGLGNVETATSILEQVAEQFPDTRHSANARTKITQLTGGNQANVSSSIPRPGDPS